MTKVESGKWVTPDLGMDLADTPALDAPSLVRVIDRHLATIEALTMQRDAAHRTIVNLLDDLDAAVNLVGLQARLLHGTGTATDYETADTAREALQAALNRFDGSDPYPTNPQPFFDARGASR